ncbi:MAG TPA: hypothetical protein VIH92_08995, partial [Solirubrobacteraceae bacterium]
FDAHADDPLADCRLQTGSFVRMAASVRDLAHAAGIPLGLVLEGGYNSRVLAECVCAILPILAGASEKPMADAAGARGRASEDERSQIARAAAQVGRYWQL